MRTSGCWGIVMLVTTPRSRSVEATFVAIRAITSGTNQICNCNVQRFVGYMFDRGTELRTSIGLQVRGCVL